MTHHGVQECLQLKSQIVQSPDRIRREISDMTSRLAREQQARTRE